MYCKLITFINSTVDKSKRLAFSSLHKIHVDPTIAAEIIILCMSVTHVYVFNQNLSTDDVVVVLITAVITAVTAVLPPFPSPCHSLVRVSADVCWPSGDK